MKPSGWFLCAALCWPVAVMADAIALRHEGQTVVEGELLGFDGRYYRILGPHGEVTLDGQVLDCVGADCPELGAPERLRISGEGSVIRTVLPPLIETFARRQGYDITHEADGPATHYALSREGVVQARLMLVPTSSSEGLADIVADLADVAVSLRPPDAIELALAREAGRGDLTDAGQRAILGLDAVIPVASALSSRTTITLEEIEAWPADALHIPDPATSAGEAILRHFPSLIDRRVVFHPTLDSLAEAVSQSRNALGLTLYSAQGDTQPLPLLGPCGASVAADPQSLKTEDYPLTAPVFLYAPMRRFTGVTRDLLRYLVSPIAQPVIQRAGLVDQFPESIPFADQGDRLGLAILTAETNSSVAGLQRMVKELRGKARLTLTFRFDDGSSGLDAQSQDNVDRLAAALGGGLFDGRRLIFAGFSDAGGSAVTNRSLSRARAEAVRDAVAEAVPGVAVQLDVAAYGEALPIACDETGWGRQVNRRVEVWVGAVEPTGTLRPGN
ncbi:OmpA family protein [Palleronia sp.]|uniref:OmpA family protein n=1 Tax=Palleronia sp. TaxID=1940284 RepID=UPI0035C8178C